MPLVNDSATQTQAYRAKHIAIVGMGVTGRSCTKFLLAQGAVISVFDRQPFDYLALCEQMQLNQDDSFTISVLQDTTSFAEFDYVVLSPGVNPLHPAVAAIRDKPTTISDLDIFVQFNHTPCIGVTGSNGKSTVVDMLQRTLTASGKTALLGGNFGTCALDLLGQPADFIVLELSSFQLEITRKLPLAVACILNVTEDHIDRHLSFAGYVSAKQRIFEHASAVVVNRDDANTFYVKSHRCSASVSQEQMLTTLTHHDFWQDQQGVKNHDRLLIPAADLKMPLPHTLMNMQFVLAIHACLKLPLESAIRTLIHYEGLPHRFEFVAQYDNVQFINDSKATNPGACVAALACAHYLNLRTILIAGGDAKGADLSSLKHPLQQWVEWCIVFGKDASRFMTLGSQVLQVDNLEQAVTLAKQKAALSKVPSLVLLSPACASIDMFKNYQHRGDSFKQAVLGEAL